MTGTIDFGVFLPQLRMEYPTIEERVLVAEEAGFTSAWFMDHMAPPAIPDQPSLEGWSLVTFLAARTSQIRLGHLVLCAPFRHPALLAKMAATLDVLSNGRLEIGIGWGSVPAELVRYGFGDEKPSVKAKRLEDTLAVMELMFSGEEFDYDGHFITIRNGVSRPTPVQEKIPVHIGGAGRKLTMPLVARYADWWNCPAYASEEYDELRPLAGDVKVSVQRVIGLARSSAEREEVAAVTAKRFGYWGGLVTGTPDEVAESLSKDAARGAELVIMQFSDFGRAETIRLFMEEVAPAVSA